MSENVARPPRFVSVTTTPLTTRLYQLTLSQRYNSPSPGSTEIRSLHNAARTLRADLLSWAETLPPSLSLRDGKEQPLRPPHVLQLQ